MSAPLPTLPKFTHPTSYLLFGLRVCSCKLQSPAEARVRSPMLPRGSVASSECAHQQAIVSEIPLTQSGTGAVMGTRCLFACCGCQPAVCSGRGPCTPDVCLLAASSTPLSKGSLQKAAIWSFVDTFPSTVSFQGECRTPRPVSAGPPLPDSQPWVW